MQEILVLRVERVVDLKRAAAFGHRTGDIDIALEVPRVIGRTGAVGITINAVGVVSVLSLAVHTIGVIACPSFAIHSVRFSILIGAGDGRGPSVDAVSVTVRAIGITHHSVLVAGHATGGSGICPLTPYATDVPGAPILNSRIHSVPPVGGGVVIGPS